MLQRFANTLTDYLLKKRIVKPEEYEIYSYGIETILSTLVNTLLVLMVGIIIGMVYETLLFLVAFAILRVYCGGYHAQTHWGCILTFSILYGFAMLIVAFLPTSLMSVFSLVSSGLSLLVIYKLAPLEHFNRPFVDNEYRIFRLLSLSIAVLEAGLTVLFTIFGHRQLNINLILSMAMLCVAFVLVYGKIKQKGGVKG